MKHFIISIIISTLIPIFGCSSDDKDDEVEKSSITNGKGISSSSAEIIFRFLDKDKNLIKDQISIILSEKRNDCNMLVFLSENNIYTGTYKHIIKKDTKLRISVITKGYNAIYKDIDLGMQDQTIDIELTSRSGITLLSYNVRDGFDGNDMKKQGFINWIKLYDPDIVMLQEMNGFSDESLQSFAKKYGHEYSVLLKDWGYPTAITSKKELTDIQKIQITDDDINPPYRVHGYIHAKSSGIDLFAIHLSSQSLELRDREAMEIMKHINRLADKSKVIVSGDFNTMCRNDELLLGKDIWTENISKFKPNQFPPNYTATDEFLNGGLIDALMVSNTNSYYKATYPVRTDYATSEYLGSRIDFVFLSKTIADKCDYAEILHNRYTNTASDHYPYLVHIQ